MAAKRQLTREQGRPDAELMEARLVGAGVKVMESTLEYLNEELMFELKRYLSLVVRNQIHS